MGRFYLIFVLIGTTVVIVAAAVNGSFTTSGAGASEVYAQSTATPPTDASVPGSENSEIAHQQQQEGVRGEAPGVPAISPRLNTDDGQPAFDNSDVLEYLTLREHQFWNPATTQPVIESIEFVSAREARELTGGWIDLPDEATVCVAVLRGEFVVQGAAGTKTRWVGTMSRMVFDAHTGNLLTTNVADLERAP